MKYCKIFWAKTTFLKVVFILLSIVVLGNSPAKIFVKAESENTELSDENHFKFDTDSFPVFLTITQDSTKDSLSAIDSLFTPDSLGIGPDTARINAMSRDSTARLEYFRHSRVDYPYIRLGKKRKSSFFAYPSVSILVRKAVLDSSGQNVIISEKIRNDEYRPTLVIPVDKYIQLRTEAISRELLEEEGHKYELKDRGDQLDDIFKDLTNIVIPLPASDVFSIFGPREISLKIRGAVDIYGAWKNEETVGLTASALGNERSEPDFKQTVQINVQGMIGDKLSINADWNTERDFEYENQLKIKYTGYDDEIIQSIEAGNVSLQTTPLIGGSEALFGIKAKLKFGPFSLTALASQKKGEVEEISIASGSTSKEFEIRAYDYSENHFFLDTVYASTKSEYNFFNQEFGQAVFQPSAKMNEYKIKEIEVWKSVNMQSILPDQIQASAFINLDEMPANRLTDTTFYSTQRLEDRTESGVAELKNRFVKLVEGSDYVLHPYTGFISFRTQIQPEDIIAAAYIIEGNSADASDDRYIGEMDTHVAGATDSLFTRVLKLIKPKNLIPDFKQAWKLQLKNIYPIGGRRINKEGFVLTIKYDDPGKDPTEHYDGKLLVQEFKLDQYDESGQTNPDGAFDFDIGKTILPETGEIIFPVLKPFSVDYLRTRFGDQGDSLAYPEIYTDSKIIARQEKQKDKFMITGEFSAAASSTYNIGFNVVENSVRVTLNGNELQVGTDYTVDYLMGEVSIKEESALVPGADLKISYEQNDLFSLASKTLFGFRGIYDFNKETQLGFSFLNLSQKTLSDKVRIGEEPLSNTIYGADFKTQMELPFLTKALDKIFSTSKMSVFQFQGEFAYMDPDPNTKKSRIRGDNGLSIAYIDDFEGAKKLIPLGNHYSSWHDLSVPENFPMSETVQGLGQLQEKLKKKAKAFWFQLQPPSTDIKDIFGDRKRVSQEQSRISVLEFVYWPDKRGSYNTDPDLADPYSNWGGMMTKLSSTTSNLDEENIEYIEFWMNIVKAPAGAELRIDLGQISEEIIPNNVLDTEDHYPFNGILDEGEDTGLDGLTDSEEKIKYGDAFEDPSNDNFFLDIGSGNYIDVNGTEGNAQLADIGRIPDSEDLNGNISLDKVNSYYTYIVPLNTDRNMNPYISGGGDNADWYQFRIPLREPSDSSRSGSPSLNVVETIRFWITGVPDTVHLRLYDINLVGNQWRKVITDNIPKDDTTLTIATINFEDNPEYELPPGVEQERDRTNSTQEVYKNEQSLRIQINDLKDGDKREIVKYLFKPLDVFNYKEMKMFVHGDEDIHPGSVSNYVDESNYGAELYFRFGADTLNFYEYRQPVRNGWNEVRILFDQLTAIKQNRTREDSLVQMAVQDKPGHYIGVKGLPSLTKIKFFIFGILNPADKGVAMESVNGDIWVNELRVLNADNTAGWAYKFSTSLALADILNVDFNMNRQDPYYHKLNDRFGSRNDSRNWAVGAELDVLKILPVNLPGSNLKVKYSHTEAIAKPLYMPGTDINVDSAVAQTERYLVTEQGYSPDSAAAEAKRMRAETETMTVSDSWSLSNITFKVPSNEWYFRETINKLNFSFSYNRSSNRSPTTALSKKWLWKAGANYRGSFSRDNYFQPVDIPILGYLFEFLDDYKGARFYFTPRSISMTFNADRNWSYTLSRSDKAKPNIQRDFKANRSFSFDWLLTENSFFNIGINYSVTVNSSYAHLLTIEGRTEDEKLDKPESEIWRDLFSGNIFGRDQSLVQNAAFKLSPRLPSIWGLDKYFKLSFDYSSNYQWQNNFQMDYLGRSAAYNSRLSAGITLRLKSIADNWFADDKAASKKPTSPKRSSGRRGSSGRNKSRVNRQAAGIDENKKDIIEEEKGISVDDQLKRNNNEPDSLNFAGSDSLGIDGSDYTEDDSEAFYEVGLLAFGEGLRWLMLDYDNISANFSQANSRSGSGLGSEHTGFTNFWTFSDDSKNGPSYLFMLGFSNDIGLRAINGKLQDNFKQDNTITMKTSKELWKGAKLDIDWKVTWGINRSQTINTGPDPFDPEFITFETPNISGRLERSHLYLPFIGNIPEEINKNFVSSLDTGDVADSELLEILTNSFRDGVETSITPQGLFPDEITKYFPSPNWRFTWTGLEKLPFVSNVFDKLTLNHSYTSDYTEGWKLNTTGDKLMQTQRVSAGFNPLIGLNFQINKLLGGNFTGSFRFNSKSTLDLVMANYRLQETFTQDISFSASYSRSGFELPLFGLDLKNDITISFAFTSAKNSKTMYDLGKETFLGVPLDGTTRTTYEPKVKYVMSSKVTASIFYRRTTVVPEGASKIPETITNEYGLDVHIAIQ